MEWLSIVIYMAKDMESLLLPFSCLYKKQPLFFGLQWNMNSGLLHKGINPTSTSSHYLHCHLNVSTGLKLDGRFVKCTVGIWWMWFDMTED